MCPERFVTYVSERTPELAEALISAAPAVQGYPEALAVQDKAQVAGVPEVLVAAPTWVVEELVGTP